MDKIRRNVFETNSSSCHSISLGKGDFKTQDLQADENGVIQIYPGEFGWDEEEFCDAATKASYALTWAQQIKGDKYLEMLKKVIEEITRHTVLFVKSSDEWYPWGYIDHQSFPSVGLIAFESEETLKNFIFNPESILRTDNDNY